MKNSRSKPIGLDTCAQRLTVRQQRHAFLAIELGTPEFEKFLPAGSAKVILRDIVAGPQQINYLSFALREGRGYAIAEWDPCAARDHENQRTIKPPAAAGEQSWMTVEGRESPRRVQTEVTDDRRLHRTCIRAQPRGEVTAHIDCHQLTVGQ